MVCQCGKDTHATRQDAVAQLQRALKRRGRQTYIYRCQFSFGYHISTKRKRKKLHRSYRIFFCEQVILSNELRVEIEKFFLKNR